ncbi:BatD family protein [Rubripirellula reticaptiva]|uniref:Tetratricopeptide repeat protein n=1 Tax=Rubripirellula reticaptiva TaxID=2528013 RepID=A0A5C6EQU6_9BACT|nr:BatD family protein [Rubripirellula reticaptiva]TWU51308.1 Tetratricopeptide repeat protein [Rubripirellula reticaptiva]
MNLCRQSHLTLSLLAISSIALFLTGWPAASAADVAIAISSKQAYVGMPVTLQIRVDDASGTVQPEIPDVDGLSIVSVGRPQISSQIVTFNGRQQTNRTSMIYQYEVTAERAGEFVIPPIKITGGGAATITEAVRFTAEKSETGDTMFVEIVGEKDKVFVGQSLNVTLKIWVLPYHDEEKNLTLGESEMWRSISKQTNWGPFEKSLEKLAGNRQRPGGREVIRTDSKGKSRNYFLYEIDATIYPTHAGKISADDVRIVLNYPVSIGRRRDPFASMFEAMDSQFGRSAFQDDFFRGFTSGLAVTSVRPVVAEATAQSIEVVAIPSEGRPDDYVGAVGQYSIDAEASDTNVKVGDPITLTLTINGTGPMDLVRAPPLASQSTLTEKFKVAEDDLAGFVQGQRKLFQTTIRPKSEDVSKIPPIAFTFFDPETGKFVTVASDPISIDVQPGDMLALDSVVANRAATVRSDETKTSSGGLGMAWLASARSYQTVFDGSDVLVNRDRASVFSRGVMVACVLPPVLFLGVCLLVSRNRFWALLPPNRRFERAVAAAGSRVEVKAALSRLIASRLGAVNEQGNDDFIIGLLRRSGQYELAIRAERLFASSESVTGSESEKDLESFKNESRSIASQLKAQTHVRARNLKSTKATASIVIALMVSMACGVHAVAEQSTMTAAQREAMLSNAMEIYRTATQESSADSAADLSKQSFAEAAQMFQAIADSGVVNDRLFFNLGNAAFQSDQPGRAIAAYRKALRIDPESAMYHDQLRFAESEANIKPDGERAKWFNDAVLRLVPPAGMKVAALGIWSMGWAVAAATLLFRGSTGWKRWGRGIAAVLVLASVVAGASYAFRVLPLVSDSTAVIVASEVAIHEGDGQEFAVVEQLEGAEGEVAEVVSRRGGWTQIRRSNGVEGWVANRTIELI